jgi:acid phosphatase type 7
MATKRKKVTANTDPSTEQTGGEVATGGGRLKPGVRTKSGDHAFAFPRPSERGKKKTLHQKSKEESRDTRFRPLPPPSGKSPFRLDLADVISAEDIALIKRKKRLIFHLNGDMGGIKSGENQVLVARGMEGDFDSNKDAGENPAFLYLVGDCVYYNGEVKEYFAQFYEPYEYYNAPIFAVPGNHDGENLEGPGDDATLTGFIRNFCAATPGVKMPESQDCPRTAMNQPNVYWTLLTPLINIIGLYSNVPGGGQIKDDQKEWLIGELKDLPDNLPLCVALHHPLLSGDDHHSGSTHMKDLIDEACAEAKRTPDLVLAGHVHNYQRITRTNKRGSQVHLVTGAGGYYNLHNMMKVDGEHMVTPASFQDSEDEEFTIEKYSADHHGFLRLEVTNEKITGRYYEVPRPQEPYSKGNSLFDYFEFDWKNDQYIPNRP